jgi:hypothetical protein
VPVGDDAPAGAYVYDEETCSLRTPYSLLRVFQKVVVAIAIDNSKAHRPRLVVDIAEPQVRRTPAITKGKARKEQ